MNKNLTRNNNSSWSLFQHDLWDVFDRFSKDLDVGANQSFMPKIEIKDQGKNYQVCAEIPGMDEKDISVSLKDNQLIIEGEKKSENKEEKEGFYHSEFSYGKFFRAIPLSEDINSDEVHATYKNGVLNIEVAKNPEKKSSTKRIEIH
jgi:HSP20 family protein